MINTSQLANYHISSFNYEAEVNCSMNRKFLGTNRWMSSGFSLPISFYLSRFHFREGEYIDHDDIRNEERFPFSVEVIKIIPENENFDFFLAVKTIGLKTLFFSGFMLGELFTSMLFVSSFSPSVSIDFLTRDMISEFSLILRHVWKI